MLNHGNNHFGDAKIYDIIKEKMGDGMMRMARVECGACGGHEKISLQHDLPPDVIIKQFERKGWVRTGAATLKCPTCMALKPKNDPNSELERFKSKRQFEPAAVIMAPSVPARPISEVIKTAPSPQTVMAVALKAAVAGHDEEAQARKWLDELLERGEKEEFCLVNVIITPMRALVMMDMNDANRHMRPPDLEKLRYSMEHDDWARNGESIKISKCRKLNDGQHRLTACVETNINFVTDLRFGLERDTRDTLDQGRNRTTADVLVMNKVEGAGIQLAAAGRFIIQLLSYGCMDDDGVDRRSGKRWPTRAEIISVIQNNPELSSGVEMGKRLSMRRLGSAALHTALHYLFALKTNSDTADKFYDSLINMIGLSSKSHPVYVLRTRLETMREDRKNDPGKQEAAGLTIKAWNAWISREEIQVLRLLKTEPFPKIKGIG